MTSIVELHCFPMANHFYISYTHSLLIISHGIVSLGIVIITIERYFSNMNIVGVGNMRVV